MVAFIRLIAICMVLLSAIGFAQAESEIVLNNDSWTITINPNSLQVIAEPVKGESIQLSLPQQGLGLLDLLLGLALWGHGISGG